MRVLHDVCVMRSKDQLTYRSKTNQTCSETKNNLYSYYQSKCAICEMEQIVTFRNFVKYTAMHWWIQEGARDAPSLGAISFFDFHAILVKKNGLNNRLELPPFRISVV